MKETTSLDEFKARQSNKVTQFAMYVKAKLLEEVKKNYILHKREVAVLAALLKFWSYESNQCWPSLAALANESLYCADSVITGIRGLESKGLVNVVRVKVPGRNRVNKYSFTNKILNLMKEAKKQDPAPKLRPAKQVKTCISVERRDTNQDLNINNKTNREFVLSRKLENKTEELISSLKQKDVLVKPSIVERFLNYHSEEVLQGSLEAINAYIKQLAQNKQQYEAARIVSAALNITKPWKPNKNKTVEIDALKAAEKDKDKLKTLFQRRQTVQCLITGYTMQLEQYMYNSPNYMIKKLNETGKYDWYVCEMFDSKYIYIPLHPLSEAFTQAA